MEKIIKFLSCFIPIKSLRRKFRDKFIKNNNSNNISVNSQYYGKIYVPYYPDVKFSDDKPDIYNKDGKKMDIFFIRDKIGSHCPYSDSSKYFLWDRFNIGLDTHFYTHGTILETMGEPAYKYGYFVESESIVPEEYAIFEKHKGIEKDFDAIFTYSEKLLNTLDNAKFFCGVASMWYTKEYYNGIKDPTTLDENVYLTKNKNVSMICSSKTFTPMHKIRHKIAQDAMNTGKVDIFGGFKDGIYFDYKSRTLKDYRFQIVVENDISPYYFSEKIIDCFASMTIPIYLGGTKIADFFNPDGIITINKDTDINNVLKICTEAEYNSRLAAVKDNYYRSLKHYNVYDLLYEQYFMKKTDKSMEKINV